MEMGLPFPFRGAAVREDDAVVAVRINARCQTAWRVAGGVLQAQQWCSGLITSELSYNQPGRCSISCMTSNTNRELLFLRACHYAPDLGLFLGPAIIIPDYGYPPSVCRSMKVNQSAIYYIVPSWRCRRSGECVTFAGRTAQSPLMTLLDNGAAAKTS
jgi:hypothetical protein